MKKAPKQLCNSPEAFDGFVMEFRPEGQPGAPVGTLSEYLDADTHFTIHTADGYILNVNYNPIEKIFNIYDKEYVHELDVDVVDGEFVINDEDISKLESAVSDAEVDISIENDGIGAYEFWGQTGYDEGSYYAVIDNEICTRLVLNIKNCTITKDDIKIIWNYIADNMSVEHTFSKSGGDDENHDGWSFDIDCKLVASEFKLESPTKATLLLTWEEK